MLLLSCVPAGRSQSLDTTAARGFEFLPGGTLFPPPVSNLQEPRVGVRKELGSSRLKLDIGSTLDFLQYTFDEPSTMRLRVGAEFFTYALTTSAEGLRLQVDAVDGFFGGHILFRAEDGNRAYTVRLRLMHLSAHLVDGHFDTDSLRWKDGRLPIPFTRDFGELLGALTFPLAGASLTVYTGFSYATLVRPGDLRRLASLHGFDIHTSEGPGTLFGKPYELYGAYTLTLAGVPAYTGTNVLEGGVKLGRWSGHGIRLYVNYASGLEFFSQYYNERRSMWGAGFTLEVL
jgi:hypothetical protein